MTTPFNAYLSSGQALLDAIPRRAAAVIPDVIPLPMKSIISISLQSGHIVAWTCKIAFAKDFSVRIAWVGGTIHIAHTSAESLDLLRCVQKSGTMQSYAWNDRTRRWVRNDY